MKYSLRSKLTLSYLFIVIIIVGLISLIANTYIRKQFEDYVMNRQEKQTSEIISLIKEQFQADGMFNNDYLERVGMHALEKGLVIKLTDPNNELIWSASHHNNGLCEAMMLSMQQNMYNYHSNWEGQYEEKTYAIISQDLKIATLTTGYIGPYYFNTEELIFIQAFNKLFIIIGIISLVLACILGFMMSLKITHPLKKIAQKARLLSEGNYQAKLEDTSNTKEIEMLSHTINTLSEALERKDKLRKQLTQDVAHELRTPLSSVQGHMEAMIDGIWEMDTKRLSSCYDEIIRIQKLIGSIENLSGLENENSLIHKQHFDLSQLILRLLDNYQKELLEKNIKVYYDPKHLLIYADPDKISQVLNNLLSNAIKYSNALGTIEIDAYNDSKATHIYMKDTGLGIGESDLPFIFERFYRADKSRSSKMGGMGLGLTITQTIIEAHGGTITAKSKLHEGSEFIIWLPLC